MASNLKLGTRIYLSMLMLLIVSFIIIGATTVYHFSNQNDEYHAKRLKRKEKAVIASIDYFLEQKETELNADSIVLLFNDKICELADINNLDINIYSLSGDFLISSREEFFEKGIFVWQLDKEILAQLDSDTARVVIETSVDTMSILSTYHFILDTKKKPAIILNIPYPQSNEAAKSDLQSFFIALSQVYLFLFIGASILAFFLSNYITGSLKAIASKLTNYVPGQKHESIQWDRNDEIGALVKTFNRVLEELEANAQKLAKSERESAWREMAKQVAHEIKNPLTPMKLNVQHLARTLKSEEDGWENRLEKFTNAIVEQIDTLSNIASEFSNFAQMPTANNEKIKIKELILSTIELYSANNDFSLNQAVEIRDATLILMDRDQLKRVVNNLIKNAIQAIPENQKGEIIINGQETEDVVTIKVVDNGKGIDEEVQQRIFEPNFTTKTGGMGLGLAMVKNIIEQVGGKITFETELNVGTSFIIQLPKHKGD